ncbi:hypothetical protein NDU88_003003 [Pleurodeles waltl]|uniref:Uncharacterized protein n=1 Tax=Pleurodeles waltl TaxID=8319 RepID=A0AAV7T3Z7_PLEWA|nr:hypothetical protein NDU88_003003 [Pleurodeles waltl]
MSSGLVEFETLVDVGAWPRWRREQTRSSELRCPGPSKGFAAPFFAAPGPPGQVRGIKRRQTPRGRAGSPSEERYGGVGHCGLGCAGDRRPAARGGRATWGGWVRGGRLAPSSNAEVTWAHVGAAEVPEPLSGGHRRGAGVQRVSVARGAHFFAGPVRAGGPGRDLAQHCLLAPLFQVGGAWTGARGLGRPSAVWSARGAPARGQRELGACNGPRSFGLR